MRYEAEGVQYTESDFTELACMECLDEFVSMSEAEQHVLDNPGHVVVASEIHEIEIVAAS